MKRLAVFFLALAYSFFSLAQDSSNLGYPMPNTGISGVYEAMIATDNPSYYIRYFAEFGFHVVDSGRMTATNCLRVYGVNTALKSYRLQNGETDTHGLIRLLVWQSPLGNGVGFSEPETIGSRMMVMRTNDILRLTDLFKMLRNERNEKWLVTNPVFDDPLGTNKNKETDFFNRPSGVSEAAVYGEHFGHVFFQRYGYGIPGYGTIADRTPLKTSELTHHGWFIKVDSMQQLMYLQTVLGLKAEKLPVIDTDSSKGVKAVFMMKDGYTHWYQGFVSPNNICGKLKFFMPIGPKPDHSAHQRIGEWGLTLHSFYTNKLEYVFLLVKTKNLKPKRITLNEFGERCFVFTGPEGTSWQIIERKKPAKHQPQTKTEFISTND